MALLTVVTFLPDQLHQQDTKLDTAAMAYRQITVFEKIDLVFGFAQACRLTASN